MGQDKLDQYIKESLSNHPTPLDKEALWTSINSAQTRRKNVLYLGVFVFFSAIAVLLLSYLSGENSADYKVTKEFSSATVSGLGSDAFTTTAASYSSSASNLGSSQGNTQNTRPATIEKNTIQENSENAKSESREPGANAGTYTPSKKGSENTQREKSITQATSQPISSMQNSLSSAFLKTNEAEGEVNSEAISGDSEYGSSSPGGLPENRLNFGQFAILGRKATITELSYEQSRIPMRLKTTDCPRFGHAKSRLFVEAYSLLDYTLNSYSSSQDFAEYVEERKSTQSYRPSYRAGVQFKYLFDNGLFIKAGVEYARSREKFRYRRESIRTEIRPDQVIHVHIDTNGDTTVVLGNAPVTIIETKNWRVKNSYTSLDIPLSIGYQVQNGPWFYAMEMGLLYNVNFSFSGMLLDISGEPAEGSSYFKSRNRLGYNAALSIGYRLKENLNFIIRTSLRSPFNTVNSTLNPVDQKMTNLGLGVGLEYEF